MPTPSEHAANLTDDDKAAMQAFLRFYEPRRAAILARARPAAPIGDEHLADETRALLRAAVLEDRWAPFLDHLRAVGARYAAAGVAYHAWAEPIRAHRDAIRDELAAYLAADPRGHLDAALAIARGMDRIGELVLERLGDAYLAAKEELARDSEARYRMLFERSPLPMWSYDRATLRFTAVNDAAIRHYGYTREELATMTLADIRPAEDVAALHADVRQAAGLTDAQTWRHRKKDGTLIDVEIRANDFTIDGKDVRLVQITDVTERVRAQQALRRAEDQLRHAQKMDAIGRLAGSVAHDFNNVLTVVQSYATMLEDRLDVADARHADAAEIRRTAERAARITRQLLTLSRHGITAPRPVDLDALIAGFAPLLRHLLGERVQIAVHEGEVPDVLVDPGQIEQVLLNLATNACDAMPDGGRLSIETRRCELDADGAALRGVRAGAFVELAVTDTGAGIDRETQARIFEPFFTTKDSGKGTGLGLSIVHGIVTQAGGAISVYSEPGQGSTFRVLLPVADGAVAGAPSPEVDAPRTLPPLRVLVVDDQPEVRAVAARILQDAGCKVIEAAGGDEARTICVAHEEPIDVVVLDVVLQDGRGDVLRRQLEELRPGLAFVQMSGYPVGALSAAGAAPEHLLAKPFSPAELRGAVARAHGLGDARRPAAAPAERGRHRVLLVDDDAPLRRAMVRMLRAHGFEVVDADSGNHAIATLGRESFDAIVTDVHMPDGGGLDLVRAVRRIDLDVPVILVTGEPSVEAAARAVEYGAFRYLTKPIDTATLVKTLEHAARAHALARLRREAFGVTGAHAGVADRAGLEVRFDQALAGMWMAVQPIVHATSGLVFGVEALMRSDEPSIPNPGALLDAAAQLGRLPLVGRKVRALASAALARRGDGAVLFVNLHPEDLHDVELIDDAAPLSAIASRVVLEVTERAALDTTPALAARIARLRELGFRIAVDDIGAGYSGLTSFTELQPEFVKLDMALVRDVHASALKQRTIGALCRLCHEVGTLVVGEGIETIEERDALVALGCDLLQGYLFGRPARP